MSDTTTPPPQFTSALGDPFDPAGASNLHQPGFLGVSPDVWRSLANFGGNLAAAANARTPGGFLQYGGGFGGPFGAAVSASQGQGMQRGVDLSHMALNRANAQSAQMDNYIKAMNLPIQLEQNRMLLEMMQNPQAWASKYGFGAPTFGGQSTASGNTPEGGSDFYKGISKIESGGKADAQNPLWNAASGGPLGTAQFTGDTWLGFARENPQYFQGKSTPDILAMRSDPNLQATATDWYAAKNASVLQQQGIDPSPQNLGIAHALGGAGAANVLSKPDQTPLSSVMSPQVLQMNPQYARMTVGDLKAKYAGIGAPSFMAAQNGGQQQTTQPTQQPTAPAPYKTASNAPVAPPSQPASQPIGNLGLVRKPNGDIGTPVPQQQAQAAPSQQPTQQPQTQQQQNPQALRAQQFTQAAEQAEAQASQLENQRSQIATENARRAAFIKTLPPLMQSAAAMNPNLQPLPMPPGDPAAIRTNAQQYRDAALKLSQPISTREGIYDPITGKTIYRNPQLIHGVDPRTGQETAQWMPFNEDENGNPINTNPVVTKLGPGQHEALEGPSKEFNSEPAIKSYNSSVQTLGWTETMQQDFDSLNKSGDPWSKTGPGADIRMHAAATINDAFRSVGLPEVFNPSKIADWESLQKQTRVAGMQLTSSLFGAQREAATVVHSAIASVPGDSQSPQGAQKILNIIKEGAQYQVDRRNYIQSQARQNGGDYLQPGMDFDNSGKTIKSYMIRAMSQTAPIQLTAKNPQEFYSNGESKRYLPGTLVRSASGAVFPVPDLNQQQQAQGGNG